MFTPVPFHVIASKNHSNGFSFVLVAKLTLFFPWMLSSGLHAQQTNNDNATL